VIGLDGFEAATPPIRTNICNDHDHGIATAVQVTAVIKISLNANRHEPETAVHPLSPPIRRPDLKPQVHDPVVDQGVRNQRRQQCGCMPLPRAVGGNGNIGDPARSIIDPGCGMADDRRAIVCHEMDAIGSLDFIEIRSMRPSFAVRSGIDVLQRGNV
jgi:hypothetical protein